VTAVGFVRALPHRRLATIAGIGLLCLLAAWGAGFLWFIEAVARQVVTPPHAEGIVAFTGGADRVETALRLLAEGRADKLLLSGVGGGADLGVLAHRAGVEALPLAARVTLGRSATTTWGNAVETASWAKANEIRSLIVVTAFYHMPRALIELRRVLPDVALYPLAVHAQERGAPAGVPLRLMAEEYTKLLAAWTGLTAFMPGHGGHA
jgi:uncharacterized SAM-binding protein YcdF (DUF218 family)